MTADPTDRDRNRLDADDGIIEAVDFEPMQLQQAPRRWRPTPLLIAAGTGLIVALLIMLYLLTARSLYVRSSVADAEIRVDGLLTFAVEDHFLLLPGEHQVRVTAAGHLPREVNYKVSNASTQYLDVELQPMPGHLLVNSNAPASVFIDGELRGNSGERLTPISRGEHQLRLQADRYQPWQETIFIEGRDQQQRIEVQLSPAWAEVQINSDPAQATLLDNGVEIGTTPLTAQLDAGKHELSLTLPGHKTWTQILRVEPEQQLTLPTVQLQPANGLVNVKSAPAGARVTVNGQFHGRTPLQLELPPQQTQQLSLLLEGYQAVNQELRPRTGEELQLSFKLQPTLGEIRFDTTPADALLYVDGVLLGRARQTLTLPTRQHRIRISKPGYADHTATVLPRAGLEQLLQVQLLTEEQQRWKNIERRLQTAAGQTLLLFRPNDTFTMGASRREQGRRANESQHAVTLNRAFYLGERLVSNAEYRRFERFHSSGNVRGNSLNGEQQPVVNVSWIKAAQYCNWLSEQDRLPPFYQISDGQLQGINPHSNGYRLPSEAEWAWAARLQDGVMQKYGWGDQLPPPANFGNFGDRSAAALLGDILLNYDDGYAVTAPSGRFAANHRQLYDINGNAAEWIHDYYGITTGLSLKPEINPLGPEKGDFHVIRGSSWAHATITDLRLSFRDYGVDGRYDVGFRIARNVE